MLNNKKYQEILSVIKFIKQQNKYLIINNLNKTNYQLLYKI